MIDMNLFEFDQRKREIIYSSEDLTLKIEKPFVHVEAKTDSYAIDDLAPKSIHDFKCIKHDEGIIATFGGEDILVLDNERNHQWMKVNSDSIVTDLFYDDKRLVFGRVCSIISTRHGFS